MTLSQSMKGNSNIARSPARTRLGSSAGWQALCQTVEGKSADTFVLADDPITRPTRTRPNDSFVLTKRAREETTETLLDTPDLKKSCLNRFVNTAASISPNIPCPTACETGIPIIPDGDGVLFIVDGSLNKADVNSIGLLPSARETGNPIVLRVAGGVKFVVDGSIANGRFLRFEQLTEIDKTGIIEESIMNFYSKESIPQDLKYRIVMASCFESGVLGFTESMVAQKMLAQIKPEVVQTVASAILHDCIPNAHKILATLLAWGANPDEESNEDALLPLERAIILDDVVSISLLLEAKGNIYAESSSGQSILALSRNSKNSELRTMFEARVRDVLG